MMVSTTENRIPSMNSIFSTVDTNAAIQASSKVSRRNSVQSGESIGDVLDLYADSDSDSDSDSVFEQNNNQESITVNNYSNVHLDVLNTSGSNINSEGNAQYITSPSLNQLSSAQTTPDSQVCGSNYVSPTTTQRPQFKVLNHTVSTSFVHSDTTLAAINDSSMNQTILNDSTILQDHYRILDTDSTDGLEIEDSLIDLINQIGLEDNDVELEFDLDLLDELSEKDNSNNNNDSKSNNNGSNCNNNIADLLNVELSSSEEEDYDDNERFNSFFELSRANSLKRISTILRKRRPQSQIPTVVEESSILPFEESPERNENTAENEHHLLERVETIHQSEILDSIDENANIDDFLSENTLGGIYMDPNPPPYAEFDVTEEGIPQKGTEFETIREDLIPEEVNSEMNSTPSKPPQRTISQRIRRELGGLNRQLSVDYYQLDRYLPPYRSMINPDQGYDYRTHEYVDATSNEFEIKPIDKNTTVVAIHKRKREGRIKSILLTTNNNIKQKILDAATDTLPLKTRTISMQSISSFNRNNVKPNIKFQTLPIEIVNLVLNQLQDDQKALVNCLYVNKTFNLLSKQILYHSPYFSSTYRFAQFVHLVSNNSKLSSLVYVLDLSHIDVGITLNESERAKLQDKMIFGSSGNRDSFFIDRDKKILAGWRDWKFRDHPLYGGFSNNRFRAGSSSSAATVHWSSNTGIYGSTDSVFDQRKNKSAGTLTLVNSRRRSDSGSSDSEHNLKKSKPKLKARQRSNSHTNSTQNINNGNSNDGSIFKSLKNAFGKKATTTPNKKYKQIKKKVTTKPKTAVSNSSTTKPNSKLTRTNVDSKIEANIDGRLPFSTPHPKQSQFLSQYCFTKDIPVGHILHVLKECENLEEINFSDITVSADFELNDYEDFNWETGKGKLLAKGKPRKILDKAIYWSDTDREMDIDVDLKNGQAVGLEISAVWKEMLKLNNIKKITLSNISSLEQSIVEAFVMRSNFKNKIEYLDCTGSGLVKRQEWDELKTGKEWRRYFKKLQR